jgi:hypothetical protein
LSKRVKYLHRRFWQSWLKESWWCLGKRFTKCNTYFRPLGCITQNQRKKSPNLFSSSTSWPDFFGRIRKNTFVILNLKSYLSLFYDLRKTIFKNKQPSQINSKEAILLEKRLNNLPLITIDQEKYALTATFQISMIKYRNFLLSCIYDISIPHDNNGSERAIRNIKVKQKVSRQFKSG